jgi:hypothetical protein
VTHRAKVETTPCPNCDQVRLCLQSEHGLPGAPDLEGYECQWCGEEFESRPISDNLAFLP